MRPGCVVCGGIISNTHNGVALCHDCFTKIKQYEVCVSRDEPSFDKPTKSEKKTPQFVKDCENLRRLCLVIEKRVRINRHNYLLSSCNVMDMEVFWKRQEVDEQLTLSIRAFEDARMRLGKAIQHYGDGVSIYDKSIEEKEFLWEGESEGNE